MDISDNTECHKCNEPIKIDMVKGSIKHSNQENACIWVAKADLGHSIVGCT